MQTQRWLLNLYRILYSEIYAKVKIGKHLSSEFQVHKGLRQEDAVVRLLLCSFESCKRKIYSRNTGNQIDNGVVIM